VLSVPRSPFYQCVVEAMLHSDESRWRDFFSNLAVLAYVEARSGRQGLLYLADIYVTEKVAGNRSTAIILTGLCYSQRSEGSRSAHITNHARFLVGRRGDLLRMKGIGVFP